MGRAETSPRTAELEVRVATAAELPRRMRADILALCERAYAEDLEAQFRSFVEPVHVVGVLDERVVSHAMWVTRWLAPANADPLRTAYVEAVATEPELQGRGHASLLMRRLIAEIQGFDLAALSPSDAGEGLYQRVGFEVWRGPLFIRTAHGLEATPDERVMVRRLPRTPRLDLDAALSAEWRDGEVW